MEALGSLGLDHRPATFGCCRGACGGVRSGRWAAKAEAMAIARRGERRREGEVKGKAAAGVAGSGRKPGKGVVGPAVPSALRRWRLAGGAVTVPCG